MEVPAMSFTPQPQTLAPPSAQSSETFDPYQSTPQLHTQEPVIAQPPESNECFYYPPPPETLDPYPAPPPPETLPPPADDTGNVLEKPLLPDTSLPKTHSGTDRDFSGGEEETNSRRRRRSRWDTDSADQNGGDGSGRKRKSRWAEDDPLPVIQLPDFMKDFTADLDPEIELAKKLLHEGQGHLFANWADQGVDDEKKKCFFAQVSRLNGNYPGGLAAYIQNARHLLANSKAGKNPFDGFIPSVPSGEVLTFGDDNFVMFEEAGVKEARKAAFVLVAGGLGERLGYKGIKVSLPSETTTGTCFLQHFIESILALQEASCNLSQERIHVEIPFVIMTSDDTHIPTLKLLESNYYFGMKPDQVILVKQEKVACLDDNDARIALDPNDKYMIQTKPHGHGDVHSLLYNSGLLNKWLDSGLRWVLFYQDTNGLLFKAIPASLGVSVTKGYHVNSLAVPRKAKEAIGGITKLTHSDGRTMVINVEYNQLDPLLRATGHADGDVNGETGFSPFPGNINQLILELGPYIEELTRTHGAISEFVNPKYKDSSKTSFKSSTRLECMMQDYPKTLPSTARVGFTVMDTWLAYAPVKNNPEDAAKVPKGNPYHSATSGEMAIYRANCLILRKAGVKIADPATAVFNGQEVEIWPRITWKPKWALTFSDVQKKVKGVCSFSQRSTMVLNGPNIYLQGLSLDGTLVIHAVDEAEVRVSGLVQNNGWVLMPTDYKDKSLPEEIRIRGFVIEKLEQLEISGRENSASSD